MTCIKRVLDIDQIIKISPAEKSETEQQVSHFLTLIAGINGLLMKDHNSHLLECDRSTWKMLERSRRLKM